MGKNIELKGKIHRKRWWKRQVSPVAPGTGFSTHRHEFEIQHCHFQTVFLRNCLMSLRLSFLICKIARTIPNCEDKNYEGTSDSCAGNCGGTGGTGLPVPGSQWGRSVCWYYYVKTVRMQRPHFSLPTVCVTPKEWICLSKENKIHKERGTCWWWMVLHCRVYGDCFSNKKCDIETI